MTKFIDKSGKVKEVEKTVFTKMIISNFQVITNNIPQPCNWRNVEYLGYDITYGDVFKAYDGINSGFTLYFGTKGDEDYINE